MMYVRRFTHWHSTRLSSVHLPLEQFGLEMIQPLAPLAHPLDDGTAVMLERSIEATAAGLGIDAKAYRKLMTPLVAHWDKIKGFHTCSLYDHNLSSIPLLVPISG